MSPRSMLELSERIRDDMDTATLFQWHMHAQRGDRPKTAD